MLIGRSKLSKDRIQPRHLRLRRFNYGRVFPLPFDLVFVQDMQGRRFTLNAPSGADLSVRRHYGLEALSSKGERTYQKVKSKINHAGRLATLNEVVSVCLSDLLGKNDIEAKYYVNSINQRYSELPKEQKPGGGQLIKKRDFTSETKISSLVNADAPTYDFPSPEIDFYLDFFGHDFLYFAHFSRSFFEEGFTSKPAPRYRSCGFSTKYSDLARKVGK